MEHELLPNGLIRLTKSVVDWVYQGIPAPVLQYLHYDIVWINDRYDQYLYGYSAACRGIMTGTCPPAGEVIHHHYHVRAVKRDVAVVTGQFRAIPSGKPAGNTDSHCTFIWSWSREEAKLLHVHISQAYLPQEEARQLLLRGEDGSSYYLFPLELVGGVCLPVPEKQYISVVCSLESTVRSFG